MSTISICPHGNLLGYCVSCDGGIDTGSIHRAPLQALLVERDTEIAALATKISHMEQQLTVANNETWLTHECNRTLNDEIDALRAQRDTLREQLKAAEAERNKYFLEASERSNRCAAAYAERDSALASLSTQTAAADRFARQVVELREECEELRKGYAVDALSAQLAEEIENARGYAGRLFLHYHPECELQPDLMGVLTQLDNMTTVIPKLRTALAEARAELSTAHADAANCATHLGNLIRREAPECEPALSLGMLCCQMHTVLEMNREKLTEARAENERLRLASAFAAQYADRLNEIDETWREMFAKLDATRGRREGHSDE